MPVVRGGEEQVDQLQEDQGVRSWHPPPGQIPPFGKLLFDQLLHGHPRLLLEQADQPEEARGEDVQRGQAGCGLGRGVEGQGGVLDQLQHEFKVGEEGRFSISPQLWMVARKESVQNDCLLLRSTTKQKTTQGIVVCWNWNHIRDLCRCCLPHFFHLGVVFVLFVWFTRLLFTIRFFQVRVSILLLIFTLIFILTIITFLITFFSLFTVIFTVLLFIPTFSFIFTLILLIGLFLQQLLHQLSLLLPSHLHLLFHPLFACIIHTDVLHLAGNLLPPHPSLPVLLKLLQLLLLLHQLLILRFQPFSSSCFFLLKTKRLDQHVVGIVVCRLRFFVLVSPHGSDALPLVQVFPALVKVVGLLLSLLVSSPFLSLLFLALSDQVLYELFPRVSFPSFEFVISLEAKISSLLLSIIHHL